jgi:hypothetical protein
MVYHQLLRDATPFWTLSEGGAKPTLESNFIHKYYTIRGPDVGLPTVAWGLLILACHHNHHLSQTFRNKVQETDIITFILSITSLTTIFYSSAVSGRLNWISSAPIKVSSNQAYCLSAPIINLNDSIECCCHGSHTGWCIHIATSRGLWFIG